MKKKGLLVFVAAIMLAMTSSVSATEEINDWANLKTCLTSVEDATCSVGEIADSSSQNESIIIKGNKVLDLGGKTLALANTTRLITEKGTSLTISNGTIEKSTRSGLVTVRVGSKLTVSGNASLVSKVDDNIAIISIVGNKTDDETKTVVNIEKGASIKGTVGVNTSEVDNDISYGVEINVSGIIEANGDSNALTINGEVKHVGGNAPVINIFDGAVISASGNSAVYAAGYGIWNVKGGEITGREAIGAKAGILNITGGNLKATGEYVANPTEEPGKASATGAAISIINGGESYGGNVSLIVENAKVTSEHGYAIYEGQGNENKTVLTNLKLKSGTFTGGDEVEKNALNFVSSEKDETDLFKEFIFGGTYTGTLKEIYVSSKLEMEKDKNGNIVVKKPIVETDGNERDENPSTGDNLLTYVSLSAIALIGTLGTSLYLKKVNE